MSANVDNKHENQIQTTNTQCSCMHGRSFLTSYSELSNTAEKNKCLERDPNSYHRCSIRMKHCTSTYKASVESSRKYLVHLNSIKHATNPC